MRRNRIWHTRLLAFLSVVVMLVAPAVAAQEAGPQGRAGDAAGWRVAGTRELDIDGEPISLSPDGQWIAGRGPIREFCVWDVAELDPVCAPEGGRISRESIVWAPDSTAVAYSLDFARSYTESDIFVFDVASGSLSNLTEDGNDDVPLSTFRLESGPILIDVYPAWSLDGKELTFARTDWTAAPPTTTLMTISADGGEPVELLELETKYHFLIDSPMRWLENGSLLYTIWSSVPGETDDGLWVYEPGGEPVQLLHGTRADDYPVPLATDVYERNGTTVILGYSWFLATWYARDRDRSIGFALDLATGATISLEETLSIDNADAAPGDETFISAPPRVSPDGSAILLGINQSGAQTLAIAPVGTGEAPVAIDVTPRWDWFSAVQGFTWASNDTILVPTVEGPVVLLTLERSAEATPAAPCSCTPPPRG